MPSVGNNAFVACLPCWRKGLMQDAAVLHPGHTKVLTFPFGMFARNPAGFSLQKPSSRCPPRIGQMWSQGGSFFS